MIRAFVAIPLPAAVTAALVAAQARLPAGRPIPPENLHLTLVFLGEQQEPVVEDVHYALSAIRAPAFELSLAGLTLLGGPKPRALAAEVKPAAALTSLQRSVVQAARGAGVALGRGTYRPHVTLARPGAGLDAADAQRLRDFAALGSGFRAGPFQVAQFALVRSWLGRGGSVYEELAAYPLLEPVAF
jgi:RNA 2',3'-cyclic 3'-phosphodiesterase